MIGLLPWFTQYKIRELTLRSSMKTSKLPGVLLSVVANVFAVVVLWNLWRHIFVKVGE